MTTKYLRDFTALELRALVSALDSRIAAVPLETLTQQPCHFTDARAAAQTPVNGEDIAMATICTGWDTRARALELPKKGAKREVDREAYMQGAMAALVALGVMTVERANQIAFLTAIGRLEDYMAKQAAKDVPAQAEPAAQAEGLGFPAARAD